MLCEDFLEIIHNNLYLGCNQQCSVDLDTDHRTLKIT